MISIIDVEALGIPTILLPPSDTGQPPSSCHRCDAFRPHPQITGNLQVDPEIHLPSPGMDEDIAYYYNSAAVPGSPFINGPYGYKRTLSPAKIVQLYGTGNANLIMERGNGAVVTFVDDGTGTGTFVAGTPGVLSKVVTDTPHNLLKEIMPDGTITAYPLDITGHPTSVTYLQDAVGNTQTFSYASGLLSTIQDSVGRLVSSSYAGGLLQSIEDWAGRFTTFQYNTTLASPKNLLTTIIGPTGCQTGYQYAQVGSGKGEDWLLSGIVDPNGFGTSYTYTSGFQVATRTIAGAGTTSYTYGTNAVLTQDALGNVTTQLINSGNTLVGGQNAMGAMVTFTRNANNQGTSFQSPLGAISTTSYDASGNISGQISPLGQQTTYTHDAFNNLTSTQTPDGAIVTNIWGYAGSSFPNLLQERDISLVKLAQYTDFPGYWGGLTAQRQGSTTSFYGFDSLSSSRILVSVGGLVTDNYSYTAFGEELAAGSGTTNPHRYIGRFGYYRDIATRQYVRMRELEVTSGRWTSRDPDSGIRKRIGNLYSVTNPVKHVDPSGAIEIETTQDSFWRIGKDPNPGTPQGCCGGYKAYYNYVIDEDHCSGWLVQHVSINVDRFTCDGTLNGTPILPAIRDFYYEAWHYQSNSDRQDNWNGFTDRACSTPFRGIGGHSAQNTEARFYCDWEPGVAGLQQLFEKGPHAMCNQYAGGLLCTDDKPPFWKVNDPTTGSGVSPAHREATATWRCCTCDNFPSSSTTTATGDNQVKAPAVCGDCPVGQF